MPTTTSSSRFFSALLFAFHLHTSSSFVPLISATKLPFSPKTTLAMVDPTVSVETTTTVSETTVLNWRVIPKDWTDSETNSGGLSDLTHGVWKDASFQDSLKLYEKLTACQDSYLAGAIGSALKCLDHAFRLYGPESTICSFNGGKDAVVILHLVRAAHAKYYNTTCCSEDDDSSFLSIKRPRVIYFDHADEFPEILSFLRDTVERYDLEMLAFGQGTKFASGLQVLVENNYPSSLLQVAKETHQLQPFPMAFVLGTRDTDPNAGTQGQFAPSSSYMPPFMRVNPILEWSYGHVWHFLRLFQLPYCSLYDQGYTSLGTVKNTLPCPALAVAGFDSLEKDDNDEPNGNETESSIPRYWPAYMLRDYDQERAGRIPKNAPQKSSATKSGKKAKPHPEDASYSSLGNLSTMSEGRFLKQVPSPEPQQVNGNAPVDDTSSSSVVSYSIDEFQKTVGVLIIGDEILKGLTIDSNTHAAARALRDHNVLLKRVSVVSDDLEEIVQEINRLRKQVDVLITSGGVGPTHDDVTIKSVAAALNCDMVLHEGMAKLLKEKMPSDSDDLTEAQIKMATLPRSSKLRYLSEDPKGWPVLQCRNIFVLPGVPEFFAAKIENVAEYLSCQMERSEAYKVVLSVDESTIVSDLNRVVENHPSVTIGSYPFVSHPDYKTVITVEGRLLMCNSQRSNSAVFSLEDLPPGCSVSSKELMDRNVKMALDELITTLPEGSVLRVANDDLLLD